MNKPQNKNSKSPGSVWKILVALAVVCVIAAVIVLGWLLALQPVTLEGQPKTQVVQVQSGERLRQIAADLESQGLIRHAWAFRTQAYLSRSAAGMKAGAYQLSNDMSTPEMVNAMSSGKSAMRKVTFPEGLSLRETAQILVKNGICSDADFYGAASTDEVAKVLGASLPPKAGDAEGFLFPDTYYLAKNDDPARVVDLMLGQFKQRFYDPLWGPSVAGKPWGNLYQVVTLASLVEKEARVDSERPLIAGVLLGRLKKGMALQVDATIQYILGGHRARITDADLKVQSPYNTYLHKGLPPAPICDPGLPSLEAALHPQQTDYLFYFAPPGSKTHVFTHTYEEHLAAIKAARGR